MFTPTGLWLTLNGLDMPLLAVVYVVLVCAAALGSFRTQIRYGAPVWYCLLNLAAGAIMLLFFSAYWITGLAKPIRLLAPALLAFSLLWEVFSAPREIPRLIERECQDYPPEARQIGKRLLMVLEILTCGIGYWFAGRAILRAL